MTLPDGVVDEVALWFDAEGRPVDDPADAATAEISQTLEDGTVLHTVADLTPPAGR